MKKEENYLGIHKETLNVGRRELIENIIWITAILLIFYFGARFIGLENIQDKVESAGILGPIIFIFLKITAIVVAPLSGSPMYLVAGTLFGFYKGVLYLMIGDAIGFSISFYISRFFGKKVAGYFLSKTGMKAANDILNHLETTKGLIQSCLVFIGFPEVVSYGAGLTRISFFKFIATIILIELIPVMILVWLGQRAVQGFGEGALFMLNIFLVLVVLLGVFWLYRQAKINKSRR